MSEQFTIIGGEIAGNTILLIDDAAHATTPKLAQGACQAIEDAAVLLDSLTNEPHVISAFRQFEQRRLNRTHKIVRDSWVLGKISQFENPALISLRNFISRRIPQAAALKKLKEIYTVDFS